MRARALLIEALVGIISAAVAAGAFLWMAKQICMIQRNEKGRRCGSRMLTRENTDSALQRSKTTNRAAALPEPLPEADGRQQDAKKC